MIKSIFLIIGLFLSDSIWAFTFFDNLPINSQTAITNIPKYEQSLRKQSKRAECQKVIPELIIVKIRYWGFDEKPHVGALIVHQDLGEEVIAIFKALYTHKFPIQAMMPVPTELKKMPHLYENLTGAYQCRTVIGQKEVLSQHSLGRAIDINPLINPYVKNCTIIPRRGVKHIDRIKPEKGKIIPNSMVTQLFAKYGWDWGGNWYDIYDYQHFEKRENGEKRSPFGYITPHFQYKLFDCLS